MRHTFPSTLGSWNQVVILGGTCDLYVVRIYRFAQHMQFCANLEFFPKLAEKMQIFDLLYRFLVIFFQRVETVRNFYV